MRSLFANPLFAILLGIVAGGALSLANRWGAGHMTPEDTTGVGIGLLLVVYTAGLIVAVMAILAYRWLAEPGFAYFAISLVASLLLGTLVVVFLSLRALREQGRK